MPCVVRILVSYSQKPALLLSLSLSFVQIQAIDTNSDYLKADMHAAELGAC